MNLIRQIIAITENPKSRNAIKIKSVRNTRNRTRQTHHQAIMIHPKIVTNRRKRRKNVKIHRKKDPIKLCAKLTAKLPTTAYKSEIIKFKLDKDLLQRRIHFLTFIESLKMIFSQYIETCEILLDYPKIGGGNIKYLVKKAIRNILHANICFACIDVHIRILIAEFSGYGVKCIAKLQSHCANTTFSEKVVMTGFFNKSHIKEGSLQ